MTEYRSGVVISLPKSWSRSPVSSSSSSGSSCSCASCFTSAPSEALSALLPCDQLRQRLLRPRWRLRTLRCRRLRAMRSWRALRALSRQRVRRRSLKPRRPASGPRCRGARPRPEAAALLDDIARHQSWRSTATPQCPHCPTLGVRLLTLRSRVYWPSSSPMQTARATTYSTPPQPPEACLDVEICVLTIINTHADLLLHENLGDAMGSSYIA